MEQVKFCLEEIAKMRHISDRSDVQHKHLEQKLLDLQKDLIRRAESTHKGK